MVDSKKRITIPISSELLVRLDAFCSSVGVTRGACIAMLLDERLPPYAPKPSPRTAQKESVSDWPFELDLEQS